MRYFIYIYSLFCAVDISVSAESALQGLIEVKIQQKTEAKLVKGCKQDLRKSKVPLSCYKLLKHNKLELVGFSQEELDNMCIQAIEAQAGKPIAIWSDQKKRSILSNPCREKLMLAKQIYFYKIEGVKQK